MGLRRTLRGALFQLVATGLFSWPPLNRFRPVVFSWFLPVGRNLFVGEKCFLTDPHRLNPHMKGCRIGNDVQLGTGSFLDMSAPFVIEDDVWISPGVVIDTHTHDISSRAPKRLSRPVANAGIVICRDAWIGINAVVMSKVTRIGEGAVVGAGSVVTRNVDDWQIVAGVPARPIGVRGNPERNRRERGGKD